MTMMQDSDAALLARLAARQSPHGIVTAVSMMKDEGPFLLEWIAHHLAVGFSRIVVYTNDCSDGTDDMLIRLEEMGLAHHRRNVIPPGQRPQPSALNHAQAEPLVAESDWLLVFDADEFLCIRHGDGTIDGMIAAARAQGANGIVVTWRIFGSGGVQDWSRDPVTEQYLMAAPPLWNKGWGVKTLFMHDPDYWKLGIHRPAIRNKWLETDFPASVKWLNGSGHPMEDYFKFRGWRSILRTVGHDWAQMNHYAVKSIDSYAIRKFRGNVNLKKDKYNADYWALQDRNEVRDDSMLRYSAPRKRIFDALLSDPVLHRLHHAALERAEERLREFKTLPAYGEMVEGLRAASAVPISDVTAKPPQARDPEKIAALMSRVEKRTADDRAAEKAKAPADRRPANFGLYASGSPDMGIDPALTWVANQGILLPGDPRLFTPAGLELIGKGKFERNLARNLVRLLPKGAIHAELGAGPGFMAAVLARGRPDLMIWAQEGDAGQMTALQRVWAQNGLAAGPRLQLSSTQTPGPWLAAARPDTLAINDPTLAPDVLAAAFAATPPPQHVFLTNRFLAARASDLPAFAALFHGWGLTARTALDASLTVAFRRPLPGDAGA